jgi:hypothetical protein
MRSASSYCLKRLLFLGFFFGQQPQKHVVLLRILDRVRLGEPPL